MSFDISRFDRAYFDVEMAVFPLSTMVISQEIYDLMAGNTPGTVEYFADVKYSDSLTALPFVDMISVERRIGQIAGTVHVGYVAASFPVPGLQEGKIVTVDAGIRYAGKLASQKIFHGLVQKITDPSPGESQRGYLDGFDAGKNLMDETPASGYSAALNSVTLPPSVSGDIFPWISNRLLGLGLHGVSLRIRTGSIEVPSDTILAYPTLFSAIQAVISAYDFRYAYMTGNNDLVILDPAVLSTETPLFLLSSAGISKQQKINTLLDRVNRIPYQKPGNTADASVFWVDSDGVLHSVPATATTAITGTYNDTVDQISYPVLTSDTLRNSIVATITELESLAESVANETQRERYDIELSGFNPFVDLGDVVQISTSRYFVSRLRHDIAVGAPWKTRIEVRAL